MSHGACVVVVVAVASEVSFRAGSGYPAARVPLCVKSENAQIFICSNKRDLWFLLSIFSILQMIHNQLLLLYPALFPSTINMSAAEPIFRRSLPTDFYQFPRKQVQLLHHLSSPSFPSASHPCQLFIVVLAYSARVALKITNSRELVLTAADLSPLSSAHSSRALPDRRLTSKQEYMRIETYNKEFFSREYYKQYVSNFCKCCRKLTTLLSKSQIFLMIVAPDLPGDFPSWHHSFKKLAPIFKMSPFQHA